MNGEVYCEDMVTQHVIGRSWFLAQFKPNCHQIAERNLARQGYQVFLPVEDVTRKSGRKFVTRRQPLFAGYLFVAFDTALGGWRAINATYGISRLVSFGADPAPVPLDLICGLMLRCDAKGKLLPPRLLNPGDRVRLTEGPMADFAATVEAMAPDQRVWVLIDIMGRTARVAVQAEALRAV
jgi:transcriptional antiterminator RfaH